VPTVVTNDVLFHTHDRRVLQDVVTCIRHNTTIDEAGFARERHADRYIKPPHEVMRVCSAAIPGDRPHDRDRGTLHIQPGRPGTNIPTRCRCRGRPQQALEALTWKGAGKFYPEGDSDTVRKSLEHELALIGRMQCTIS
jgi:error-prone DNA polymerase